MDTSKRYRRSQTRMRAGTRHKIDDELDRDHEADEAKEQKEKSEFLEKKFKAPPP